MNTVFVGHPTLGRRPGSQKDEESGGKGKRISRPKKCPELGLGTAWPALGAAGSSVWLRQRAGVFTDERRKNLF